MLPFYNTETMTLHLTEISPPVAPGAHVVVLMDQAGWHMTGQLVVPDNISIIALPAKCPELNSVENIWQFMRDNCKRCSQPTLIHGMRSPTLFAG